MPDLEPLRHSDEPLSRRAVVVGVLGVAVGATVGRLGSKAPAEVSAASEFEGLAGDFVDHPTLPLGVTRKRQPNTVISAYRMNSDSAQRLKALLDSWGRLVMDVEEGTANSAMAIRAVHVERREDASTVTVAYGSSLFDRQTEITSLRPAFLTDDQNLTTGSNGPGAAVDILLQICSADAESAFAVTRQFDILAQQLATLLWRDYGSISKDGFPAPRGHLGFHDGILDAAPLSPDTLGPHVVATSNVPSWLEGGTFMAYQKLEMDLATWDSSSTSHQESVIGRSKISGAPFSGTQYADELTFNALTPMDAHVRAMHHSTNEGIRMLRRSYNYADSGGELTTAGLLFISFQSDPGAFGKLQSKFASSDALGRYATVLRTGIFACPPRLRNSTWAEQLGL